MLKILVVEDDSYLATTIKYLVEDNPPYRVVDRGGFRWRSLPRLTSGREPDRCCGVVAR